MDERNERLVKLKKNVRVKDLFEKFRKKDYKVCKRKKI
jgi:hypothetical protein